MSPCAPAGAPAPPDGALPAGALAALGTRPFGVYVHVPFCASRCGYCDFNTYVPGEGVAREGFAAAVLAEWELAGRSLGGAPPPAATVFLGGGTPTLLPARELARLLDAIPRAGGAAGRGGPARARRAAPRPRAAHARRPAAGRPGRARAARRREASGVTRPRRGGSPS